mmetsp:Transcript_70962/g.169965  ORF Transcript_70962/g.169965 Transcript_70962/m.169965 type:complete len:389 (+) Transcript_70962:102-1268(+)|eukprot:CAMPEP_0178419504 /NCGR_PEP_ID=MMETSP0689_2-20121128/25645_1 /TAXON_ID=160604 /ORGANISM="Amphidinium massartii, Strain CS-259" /LENGTH=388 /DNA_ID=CAMNT_0020040945 /DNA_START=27 /DNA_END=1193 /DNA_ORIENTATION=+
MSNSNGWSELHRAAQKGDVVAIQRLVRSGARLDAMDIFQCTPLHHAVEYGQKASILMLLGYSANVNCQDMAGFTPLHRAAFSGQATLVECLIEGKADLTMRDSYNFQTPLQLAKASAHHAVVNLLEDAAMGRPLGSSSTPDGCLIGCSFLPWKRRASLDGSLAIQELAEPRPFKEKEVHSNDDVDCLPEAACQGADGAVCAICLDKLPIPWADVPPHLQFYQTVCGHTFHCGCLQSWFDRSPICPLCKSDMQDRPSRANSCLSVEIDATPQVPTEMAPSPAVVVVSEVDNREARQRNPSNAFSTLARDILRSLALGMATMVEVPHRPSLPGSLRRTLTRAPSTNSRPALMSGSRAPMTADVARQQITPSLGSVPERPHVGGGLEPLTC